MDRIHSSASRIRTALILAALFAVVVCSTFTAQASSISVCDDSYEPNDSTGSAATVYPGTFSSLVMEDSDDYYQISVTARSTISVALSFTDSVCDIELILLTAALNQVDISNGVSDTESVIYTTSSTQTMYIRVYTFDTPSSNADYTMTISVTSPPVVPGYDVVLLFVALVSTAGVLAIVLRKRRV